jgi:hypothetical protein
VRGENRQDRGRIDGFTVEDEGLVKRLQDAFNNQQEVKVRYRSEAVTLCRSDSEDNFLTDVQVIQNSKPVEVKTGATE